MMLITHTLVWLLCWRKHHHHHHHQHYHYVFLLIFTQILDSWFSIQKDLRCCGSGSTGNYLGFDCEIYENNELLLYINCI